MGGAPLLVAVGAISIVIVASVGVLVGSMVNRKSEDNAAARYRQWSLEDERRAAGRRAKRESASWLRDRRCYAYAHFSSACATRMEALMARHSKRRGQDAQGALQDRAADALVQVVERFAEVQLVAGREVLAAASRWVETLTEFARQALDDNTPAFARVESARQGFLRAARAELAGESEQAAPAPKTRRSRPVVPISRAS